MTMKNQKTDNFSPVYLYIWSETPKHILNVYEEAEKEINERLKEYNLYIQRQWIVEDGAPSKVNSVKFNSQGLHIMGSMEVQLSLGLLFDDMPHHVVTFLAQNSTCTQLDKNNHLQVVGNGGNIFLISSKTGSIGNCTSGQYPDDVFPEVREYFFLDSNGEISKHRTW